MRVIFHVTVDAGRRCVLEDVRVMAGVAFDVQVLAEERESRQIVVEEYIVCPRNLVVTILAERALSALVRVVVLVTGEAVGLELDLEYGLDVAFLALDRLMRTV